MRYFDDKALERRFRHEQWRMILLTIVGYTLFYCMRKNFSFAMPGLEQDLGISKPMLGNCLLAGGLVYGVSKFLNGFIGDRVKAKNLFCLGLAFCALVNVGFGFAPQIARLFTEGTGKAYVLAIAVTLGLLYVLNQLFQGMGFPPCAKLIAFWVPPKELATKMSIWNCSHSIGGGLVAKICGVVMGLGVIGAANQGVGQWRWCFWVMALAGFVGLLVMWFFLPGTPEEEGLPPCPGTTSVQTQNDSHRVSFHVPVSRVFTSPVIWFLGITNLTVNAGRALISDWGPTLLQETKHCSSGEAGTALMFFEFAGIAGMLFGGWATDHWANGRVPRVCVFMMMFAVIALFAFWFLPTGTLSMASLALFGFMLYGPQALTGVAATNLCGKQLAGTSIGFISLFSYIGASCAGKLCGSFVQASGSWSSSVYTIAATVAVGAFVFAMLWRVKPNNYAA